MERQENKEKEELFLYSIFFISLIAYNLFVCVAQNFLCLLLPSSLSSILFLMFWMGFSWTSCNDFWMESWEGEWVLVVC